MRSLDSSGFIQSFCGKGTFRVRIAKPYLKVGERVRVKAGAMAGIQGVLVRKKNHFWGVITLDAIMRSITVEVDATDVEPAAPRAESA